MSHRILTQPDGDYAVWSTVVDDFIIEDASRRQIIEWYVGKEARKAYEHAEERLDDLDASETPHHGHPSTYEEAVEHRDHLDEKEDR